MGMEGCSTAHHWGRRMQAMGLQPRLMAAEFVQAFRAKNDHNDAEAIAVRQPTMRFVAIKNETQQSRLAWHRVREGWKEERTALINRCSELLCGSPTEPHYFFRRSRISVSSTCSADGAAGAEGAASAFFFSELITRTTMNITNAMIVKSITVWANFP